MENGAAAASAPRGWRRLRTGEERRGRRSPRSLTPLRFASSRWHSPLRRNALTATTSWLIHQSRWPEEEARGGERGLGRGRAHGSAPSTGVQPPARGSGSAEAGEAAPSYPCPARSAEGEPSGPVTGRSPLHLAGTLGSPAGASRPTRLPRGEAVRAQRARHARPQPAGSGTSPESRAGSGRQGRSSRGKLQRLQRHGADFSLRSAERPGIPQFRGKRAAVGRRTTRLPARCLGPCRGARAACCQARRGWGRQCNNPCWQKGHWASIWRWPH